ncbi:YeaC family protein [Endozoicomonas sp. SESOKO1]|uniref:YeaC family protein n=1 Tax=Endozoicomonas sp. SESOKO1 TaxID=2828742 RepID=UPI002149070A|nr:YeaC family protein [Endozoicomonas sp. SESOKO1]
MQLDAFLEQMTPAIHQALKQALELGKWPDGRSMTEQERDASLQAVIVYEHKNLPASERVGFMPAKCKSSGSLSDEGGSSENSPAEETTILRFRN